ncbi:uncharacterized protein LOC143860986 [Tasmannia lanceolata]|uniref:uncharacterized protein LOC143860986 n=1 Tax=Tasmannia lanceolata TaxID=3420 RepID=UPI00406288CC
MRITRSKSRLKMSTSQSHVPQSGPSQSKRNTRSRSRLKMNTGPSDVPQSGPSQSKRNTRSKSRLKMGPSQSHVPKSGPSQSQHSQPPQPVDPQASHQEQSQRSQPQDSRATDDGWFIGVKYSTIMPHANYVDAWYLPLEHRIYVKLDKSGCPIHCRFTALEVFIEGLVQENGRKLPIDVHDWRKVPHANKVEMWDVLQGVFDIGSSGRVWFLEYLHQKWMKWKFELKKMYFAEYYATDAEQLALSDSRVVPNQWRNLVTYWNCRLGKGHNEINKVNSARRKIWHTKSAKSAEIDRMHEEEWAKSIGEETIRARLFLLITPADLEPTTVMKAFDDYITYPMKLSQYYTVRDDTLPPNMGQESRELGPSSSDIRGQTSNPAKSQKISSEAKIGIDEIKAQVAKMEEQYVLMQAQLKEMVSVINKVPNTSEVSS